MDLPKFKDNMVFYVNYDWTLPIAYVYDELVYNWEYAKPIGNTDVPNLYDSRLRAAGRLDLLWGIGASAISVSGFGFEPISVAVRGLGGWPQDW